MGQGQVLVALAPNGGRGGAQLVLRRLLGAAVSAGWSVRCAVPEGPLGQDLVRDGIAVREIPDLRVRGRSRALAYVRLLGSSVVAARTLRREARHADVVVVNGLQGLPAAALARPRCPVVYVVHEVIRRPDRVALLRLCRFAVDRYVAVSPVVAGALGDAGLSSTVVENGTPWPIDPATEPRAEPPVIGSAANLTVGKGQHVLLEAVTMMRNRSPRLELLGEALPRDAEYAARLRDLADRPPLSGRVSFLGHRDRPLDHMRRWSISVLASTEPEAHPLVVLESMSVGVPVVATDNGGAAHMLDAVGVLVPSGDPAALAEALDRLLDDPALWRRCADQGRRRIADRYALDDRLAHLLAVISDAAREPSRRRLSLT